MRSLRNLAVLAASLTLAVPAWAAPLTPPDLGQASAVNAPDLLLVWPCPAGCASGGPLMSVPYSTVAAELEASLAGTFLQVANNLSDVTSASAARTNLGLGTAALQSTATFLQTANNLSDVTASAARTHLGVTATGADTTYLARASNLSDVGSVSTARTNLGLGGAALLSVGTSAGTVAAGNDSRFAGPTQLSKSTAYGFVLTDAGGEVYHPSADTTPRTWTIPANASVAFAVGTKLELVNDCSAGAITLAITSDTLEWFPAGTTGSRTLAACSLAQLTKVTTTTWVLTGVGIS